MIPVWNWTAAWRGWHRKLPSASSTNRVVLSCPPRHPSDFLRRGLVLLFIGIAVTAAMYQSAPDAYLWGVIPGAIGIALLLYYAVVGRKLPAPPQG